MRARWEQQGRFTHQLFAPWTTSRGVHGGPGASPRAFGAALHSTVGTNPMRRSSGDGSQLRCPPVIQGIARRARALRGRASASLFGHADSTVGQIMNFRKVMLVLALSAMAASAQAAGGGASTGGTGAGSAGTSTGGTGQSTGTTTGGLAEQPGTGQRSAPNTTPKKPASPSQGCHLAIPRKYKPSEIGEPELRRMGSRSARPDLGWARHSSPSIPVGVYRFRSATDRFSAAFLIAGSRWSRPPQPLPALCGSSCISLPE